MQEDRRIRAPRIVKLMNALPPAHERPVFDADFQAGFVDLLAWRRDVRRFRSDAVPGVLLESLLELTALAPSVGNCQPTRLVRVDDPDRRAAIAANFETANREALAAYDDERGKAYARLKLAGLREAPVHLAVFCEETPEEGHGLGVRTMPETRRYSAVCALHTFWLAARMHGLGVGWVSILDPAGVTATLETPSTWSFIAYLCVGWPLEDHLRPELERAGWQARTMRAPLQR
jgi:5,6-dimethylbenzimidazole synthase